MEHDIVIAFTTDYASLPVRDCLGHWDCQAISRQQSLIEALGYAIVGAYRKLEDVGMKKETVADLKQLVKKIRLEIDEVELIGMSDKIIIKEPDCSLQEFSGRWKKANTGIHTEILRLNIVEDVDCKDASEALADLAAKEGKEK
jgi:hypothetical protein